MNYKICTKCGKELPATNEFFYKRRAGLRAACKICHKPSKEKEAIRGTKYRKANKEKIKISRAAHYQNNKEKVAIRAAKYRKANPEKFAAISAKRRARKLNQTPYLTQDEKHQMELIYKKSRELGPDYQVDHIQPLSKGGLHHPNNLQIVTKKYNLQKHDSLNFRTPTDAEIYKFKPV